MAARSNKLEAMALLLDRGADLEAKDNVRPTTSQRGHGAAGRAHAAQTRSCLACWARAMAARPRHRVQVHLVPW